MSNNDKRKRNALLFLFVSITTGIFYFSWIPDSHLSSESYLPLWLRDWSNTSYNLRTAVPFVVFGFLLEAWLSITTRSKKDSLKFWFINLIVATVVVCLAEGGQFFIFNRHPDEMDVFFGVLGSQVGFVLFYLFKRLKKNSID